MCRNFLVLQTSGQEFCVSKLDMTPNVIKMWSAIVGYTATGLKMEKDFPKDRLLVSSTTSMESEHTSKLFKEHTSKLITKQTSKLLIECATKIFIEGTCK